MKAVQVNRFSSGFDQITVKNVNAPEPEAGQVQVRMLLSPINPSDLNFIRGDYRQTLGNMVWNIGREPPSFAPSGQLMYPDFPYALGGEGVGIVEKAGKGYLARRLVGRRVAVAGGPPNGTWQERCVVDARKALTLPASLTDEQGCMFIVNPLSAYAIISQVLRVRSGEWLLQSAAGSALGQIVVRLSKVLGFKTINLVRSAANEETIRMLGGDVVINTCDQDIPTAVAEATEGRGVRYAMDCVGGEIAEQMIRSLTIDGHLVVYGTLGDGPISLASRDLMTPVAKISGFFALNWLSTQSPIVILMMLRRLKKLQAAGIFDAPIEQIYAIDEIQDALALAAAPGRGGKVLLRLSER